MLKCCKRGYDQSTITFITKYNILVHNSEFLTEKVLTGKYEEVLVDGQLDIRLSWPAAWGRWSCTSALCWWDLIWRTASRCGVVSTAGPYLSWSASRGPQKCSKGWNTSLWGQTESWGCAAWRREGSEVTWVACLYPKEGCRKEGDRLLSRVCCDRTRGNHIKLKEGDLDWI